MCYTRHEPVGICGAVIPVRTVHLRVNCSLKRVARISINIEIGYDLKDNILLNTKLTYLYSLYEHKAYKIYNVFWF